QRHTRKHSRLPHRAGHSRGQASGREPFTHSKQTAFEVHEYFEDKTEIFSLKPRAISSGFVNLRRLKAELRTFGVPPLGGPPAGQTALITCWRNSPLAGKVDEITHL